MQTFSATRQILREDKRRLREFVTTENSESSEPLPLQSFLAVWLYRWSRYFRLNNHPLIARILWSANIFLTGADISPTTDIGPGLVLANPMGVTLAGRFGANLTLFYHASAGGMARLDGDKDIGAGVGLPWVGDNVTIGVKAAVMGPVSIGDHVMVDHGAIAYRDVGTSERVESPRSRLTTTRVKETQ